MKRKLHALIVEDSEPDARLLVRELRLGGFEVESQRVETAEALQQALTAQPWDVILSDYAFPQFSGDAALRIVKASGLDLPFLFVSGTIGEETAVKAMKAGAHDYVMKNNLARLTAAVERELGEAQVRKEVQQAEKMMRTSEHKYRHLFENMRDAAFLVAEDSGRIIDANPRAELLLGKTRAEIIGTNHQKLFPPRRGRNRAPVLTPGASNSADGESYEVEIVRKDGSTVATDVNVSRMQLQGHNLLLLHFRDITRRRQTENELLRSREQLRALAARLQAVREEERTQVAREIHDELGQMLTALKMDLRSIERDLEEHNNPRLNPVLDKAVAATELTDSLVKSVQRIAAELRPGILDRLGLVTALAHEAEQFQQRTRIACHVTFPTQELDLPFESSTAVFRIFQEALTNVARHAHATEVQIELRFRPGALTLEVRDNGRGIQAGDLLGPHSLGILGMKERARQLGGDVTFSAGPNGGTMVMLEIPASEVALCSK
jgi:two-component system sensor histidine kinase UhpB